MLRCIPKVHVVGVCAVKGCNICKQKKKKKLEENNSEREKKKKIRTQTEGGWGLELANKRYQGQVTTKSAGKKKLVANSTTTKNAHAS